MSLPTYVTGTAKQVTKALMSVNDDPWLLERVYPVMAPELAERELNKPGIALAFQLALHDAIRADETVAQIAGLMAIDQTAYVMALARSATLA